MSTNVIKIIDNYYTKRMHLTVELGFIARRFLRLTDESTS